MNDILEPMAVRPRLVVELNDPELNHLLKVAALDRRKTVREAVLEALAKTYPELKRHIEGREL